MMSPSMDGRNSNRLAFWILLGLAVACVVLLFLFDPARHAFYPSCPLHAFTGLDCPTCGGLRATHLALHGRFVEAFHMNPILFFVLPVLALAAIRPLRKRVQWILWIVLGVLMFGMIWRNIPG